VIPAERLAEDLWGASPPPGAAGTLRSHLSRLRALVDPDTALITRGGGYALAAGADQLDAGRFEQLARVGGEALEHGEAATAAARFREALGLWRGRALTDVADVEILARESTRLEELRLVALEGRIEADIQLGLAAEVTGELEHLLAEYPLRERLWRLMVLALYHSGRQADALAAYRRVRTVLAEELGIEPGEDLRQLEQAVLRQQVPAASPRREQHNLPARLTTFVGREQELAALDGVLDRARLVTLTGAGGAGKTRLAVEFGAGAAGRFRDGVWLADLTGIADPGLVPPQVMEALGVRQTGEMPALEALRHRLQSAELLLVLDNCEHLLGACAALTAALLGGSAGLRVLATSREPLGVPGEAVFAVPPLAVPPEEADAEALARAPAVQLFLARSALARAGHAEAAPVAVVARICRALDGLPLAIELAAARAGVLSAEEIEARLADKFRFLAYLRPVGDPRHQALKAAIDWSYELLDPEERQGFRALSVFAGGFGLAAAAAVCCGGNEQAALDLVDLLVSKSLVVAEPAAGGSRYRLLETLRQFAAERLAEAGEAGQARDRHARFFLSLAEREHRLSVLLREHDNFRAALGHTLAGGDPAGPRMARALGGFWLARAFFPEGQAWLERSLATDPADLGLRADLLRLLVLMRYLAGDLPQARVALGPAVAAAEAAGAAGAQARIRIVQAEIQALQDGRGAEALQTCQAAIPVLETAGDLEGLADAWLLASKLHFWIGRDPAIIDQALERAARFARQSANHHAERESTIIQMHQLVVGPVPADEAVSRAEALLQAASGDPWAQAAILGPLSVLYGYLGRFADARAALARSQSAFARSGARIDWARLSIQGGLIELTAGDPVAAEQVITPGYDALRAMGERGWRATLATLLAEAVYAQGRLDQALGLTQEAEACAGPYDFDAQARWRAIRAKVLARRGQFRAAAELAEQAMALVPAAAAASELAEYLLDQAEVAQLAGQFDQADASLRKALKIYQSRRIAPLAERTRAMLARLDEQRAARTL
jgi:predicted ATPase/DNA-binding SARP family transcriptional activator